MCEKVLSKTLIVHYIPYMEQLVDLLTKALPVAFFLSLRNKLNFMLTPFNLSGDVRSVGNNDQVCDK